MQEQPAFRLTFRPASGMIVPKGGAWMKHAVGWLVLLLFVIADRFLRRRFPRVWEALQLPLNLVLSAVSTVLVTASLLGMGQVLSSPAGAGDKAVVCVLLLALAAALLFANLSFWRDWYRRRRSSSARRP